MRPSVETPNLSKTSFKIQILIKNEAEMRNPLKLCQIKPLWM
jgi:hypothetical protein